MSAKARVLGFFDSFFGGTGGFDSWLTEDTHLDVFDRLDRLPQEPLTKVQLNQTLVLSHQAGVSDDFFNYYWASIPTHPYKVEALADYDPAFLNLHTIDSLEQLRWGVRRIYIGSLLYFGSIQNGYRFLRNLTKKELEQFFRSKMFDTEAIRRRGPSLPLRSISKDDRYLISEMACKTYDALPNDQSALEKALRGAWAEHASKGGGAVRVRDLLDGSYVKSNFADANQLVFSADDILEETISSETEITTRYGRIAAAFSRAREAALQNTCYYLSMVNDLDVYVATSMRTRSDFRRMADVCDRIFGDPRLKELHLRYFDPTLSAAEGHEDKGLIECLMVKSAKALVYSAGEKESYGKDAEAAMALSLGKPVIFLCDQAQRGAFYRDVHPLSRLIHFDTGVAGGALVTDSVADVPELLSRIFENRMEYDVEQPKKGYFRSKERLTKSVVRLQTNDTLLRETFWNYYHNRPHSEAAGLPPR